ncbi:MAG: hypothetical protein PHF00_10975 [Elusimicrobia bacterium]|nr:hypothetical protein [Elusimicrobiota bacterium]
MNDDQAAELGPAVPDLSDPQAINNIDTARMALRWALERMQGLQQAKEGAERKAAAEAAARGQAEGDRKDMQRVLELRGREDAQRTAYYAKLESFLSEHFAGKLDLAAFIKREIQVSELEALLRERQLQLERDYEARREQLETQAKDVRFDLEQSSAAQVAQAKASVVEARKNLEKHFAVKHAELADREVRVKAEESALEERRGNFEGFCREQRLRLEADVKAFQDSMAQQSAYRIDVAQRFSDNRHAAAAESWQRERDVLLKDISDWRDKSLAYVPQLCELQHRILAAEQSAAQTVQSARVEVERFKAEAASLLGERAGLARDLAEARRATEQRAAETLELERRLAEQGAELHRLESALAEQNTRGAELARQSAGHQQRAENLAAENRRLLDAACRRMKDADEMEALLVERFQDVENEIHQRDLAWKQREQALRRRDRDWHTRLSEWQTELAQKAEQLEDLKVRLVEIIQSYKARMSQTRGE